jgi:putative FmdB family regulatory protein
MPIYEYRCCDCNTSFEVLVRGEEAVACPNCGSTSLDKLISAPFISSGRTSRPAGQTCCGRDERCDSPPCSEGSTCRRH